MVAVCYSYYNTDHHNRTYPSLPPRRLRLLPGLQYHTFVCLRVYLYIYGGYKPISTYIPQPRADVRPYIIIYNAYRYIGMYNVITECERWQGLAAKGVTAARAASSKPVYYYYTLICISGTWATQTNKNSGTCCIPACTL